MAFPEQQLELFAEVALGADVTADPSTWTWTTLLCAHPSFPSQTISRVTATPITIKKGVAVGGSQQQTTSATIETFNHDGALTPALASSPYWPYVDAGTPIRLRMRTNISALFTDTYNRVVASGFGTSDSGLTYNYAGGTTGDMSINGTAGLMSVPGTNVTRRATIAAAFTPRDLDVSWECSVPATATGAQLYVGAHLRYVDANNNVWATVSFLTSGNIQLVVWVVVAGLGTPIAATTVAPTTYSGGTKISCRAQIVGDRVRMRAWQTAGVEPSAWHLDVRQTTYSVGGRAGLQAWVPSGNTNTNPVVFTVDNLTIFQPPYDRVEGYIADVRPTFLPAGGATWSTVQIDVGGIGMLTEKQQAPSYSPMRRSVQLASITPIAYWPLEDDQGATFGASAFPGGPNMSVTGPAVFAFSSGTPTAQYLSRFGTKPMVSVAAGARLTGVVPQSAVAGEWAVSFVAACYAPDVPGITELRIAQWETPSGTQNRWAMVALSAGGYVVRSYSDATGTATDVATYPTISFGDQLTFTIEAHQSGGSVAIELFFNDVSSASGSITGTQGPVTRVTMNPDRTNTTGSLTSFGIQFVVGHVRVVDEITVPDTPHYTVPETSDVVYAIDAWYLEPAHRRLERLCAEERVPFQFRGDPATTGMTILNAQQDGSFTSLTEAAVEAESGGLLYEHRFGYEYLPRSARYNQAVKLTINMATYATGGDPEEVLVPQLDSRAANFWTINRTNGASGSWAADAAYRQRRGTIVEERTLDVLTDDVLTDHASWRVHLGVDGVGANYPSVLLDLAANPSLIDAWLSCSLGDRVQRTNQPSIAGVGTIDQVIVGVSETISPTSWDVVLSAQPASVWDVGVWDDGVSRYSPSSTTTSGSMTTTVLSFTMSGEAWTTGAVVILLEIDGEHMTTSNISGSGTGPYTVTLSARSVNGVVKTHASGAAVKLANSTYWAL